MSIERAEKHQLFLRSNSCYPHRKGHIELTRFRLRFLLQEFDLSGPEVVIGRSPECQVTIEDPLISRQHARIRVDQETAELEDLGSRNGVRLNGRIIERRTALNHGDRIRLGTQELVFLVVHQAVRNSRTTGFMKVCTSCSTPYPKSAARCPHCGAAMDDDTISGLAVPPVKNWTFQLLADVTERALATGRVKEADRLLRRALSEMRGRLECEVMIDSTQLAKLSSLALEVARQTPKREWLDDVFSLYRQARLMPPEEVISKLAQLDVRELPSLKQDVDAFVAWWMEEGNGEHPGELAQLQRLGSFSPVANRPG
ncbi:MAG: FHA domain-containing protein [Myxococcota bacterium]